MSNQVWAVKPDSEREVWEFLPLIRVGPLAFGMKHSEIEEALSSPANSIGYKGDRIINARFRCGVTTYYEDGCLRAVAIDARTGPQVKFDGTGLVGQRPSEIQGWLTGHHLGRHIINQEGDSFFEALGLVIRAQRAGDILLTRPVFVASQWAEGAGDIQESHVPDEEWQVH